MPYRMRPIAAGEMYHVFNRSVGKIPIFTSQTDYQRALNLVEFYRFRNLPLRYSHFRRLAIDKRQLFYDQYLRDGDPIVTIYSFCIMPNHVHFLLQSSIDGGISHFMRNFQNSYSKYFNTKYHRYGSLFQSMFKAVRIESDEQLIHISRYVHLNPVTAFLIKIHELDEYRWSSFRNYLGDFEAASIIDTRTILSYFSSKLAYKEFVYDQASYQQTLALIKHMLS